METIEIKHSWEQIVGVLLRILEDGDEQGKKIAREEITRMAKVADLAIELATNKANNLAKEV